MRAFVLLSFLFNIWSTCSSALVSQSQRAYNQSHSPSPRPQTCSQTVIRSPGLPFNSRNPDNSCNYTDYYSFTDLEGMEGWVGLVVWPIADPLPTKRSHVNHRSGKPTAGLAISSVGVRCFVLISTKNYKSSIITRRTSTEASVTHNGVVVALWTRRKNRTGQCRLDRRWSKHNIIAIVISTTSKRVEWVTFNVQPDK